MVKKIVLAALLAILAVCLLGCQTVQGFGGDIQWTAEQTATLMEGN